MSTGSLIQQRRSFAAGEPNFLSTPPTPAEVGSFYVAVHPDQRALYVGVADDKDGTNSSWHRVDADPQRTVVIDIPESPNVAATTILDDINPAVFSGMPPDMADAVNPDVLVCPEEYTIYFTFARERGVYLWVGPSGVCVGASPTAPPGPYTGPVVPEPDAEWVEVTHDELLQLGTSQDALVQTPDAGVSQSITAADGDDTPLTLTGSAGQAAPLLVAGRTQLDEIGLLKIAQEGADEAPLVELTALADSTAPAFEIQDNTNTSLVQAYNGGLVLADGIERGVLSGGENDMVLTKTIVDGGLDSQSGGDFENRNQIQLRREVVTEAPPATLAQGEAYVTLPAAGVANAFVGDVNGNPVALNPAQTPIGGITFEYRWNDDTTVGNAPDSGEVKLNGSQDPNDASPATILSVHEDTLNGGDSADLWPIVAIGDSIGVFARAGVGSPGGETFYWEVTGDPVKTGADYWDIPGTVVQTNGGTITDNEPVSLFWTQAVANRPEGDMRWGHLWVGGYSPAGTQLRDNGWLMVSNTGTSDRPSPFALGDPQPDMPDAPVWATPSHLGTVESGREWTTTEVITAVSYDVWVPAESVDINYEVIVWAYPAGRPEEAKIERRAIPTVLEGRWYTVEQPNSLMDTNVTFGVALYALNSGASTLVTGGWTRGSNSNNAAPPSQGWNTTSNQSVLRISYTDLDGTDRSSELQGVTAGTEITISDTDNPTASMTWRVGAVGTDNTTYITFSDVDFLEQGPGGEPPVGGTTTVTATIPVPQATEYVMDAGANPAVPWGTSRGFLRLDGVEQAVDNDAFGVRVTADRWSKSDDWDVAMPPSGTSFGSSAPATGSAFTAAPIPPSSPTVGDRWYKTAAPGVGQYTYIDDGSSSQWVQANGVGVDDPDAPALPMGPSINVLEHINEVSPVAATKVQNYDATVSKADVAQGIRNAVDALLALGTAGSLYFPAGRYMIIEPIDLTSSTLNDLGIYGQPGAGWNGTLIEVTSGFVGAFMVGLPGMEGQRRRVFAENIKFEGHTGDPVIDPIGLYIPWVQTGSRFRNLWFQSINNSAIVCYELDNSNFSQIMIVRCGRELVTRSAHGWYTCPLGSTSITVNHEMGGGTAYAGFFTGMEGAKIVTASDGGEYTVVSVTGDGSTAELDRGHALGRNTFNHDCSFGSALVSGIAGTDTITFDYDAVLTSDLIGAHIVIEDAGNHNDAVAEVGPCPFHATIVDVLDGSQLVLSDAVDHTFSGKRAWIPAFVFGHLHRIRRAGISGAGGGDQDNKTNDVTLNDVQTEACRGLALYMNCAVNVTMNQWKIHGRNSTSEPPGTYNGFGMLLDTCYRGNSINDLQCASKDVNYHIEVHGGGCGVAIRGMQLNDDGAGVDQKRRMVYWNPANSRENHLHISMPNNKKNSAEYAPSPIVEMAPGTYPYQVVDGNSIGHVGNRVMDKDWHNLTEPHQHVGSMFSGMVGPEGTLNNGQIIRVGPLPFDVGNVDTISTRDGLNGTIKVSPRTSDIDVLTAHTDEIHVEYTDETADMVFANDGLDGVFSILLTADRYLAFINKTGSAKTMVWTFRGAMTQRVV